jgi:hypothetical protein
MFWATHRSSSVAQNLWLQPLVFHTYLVAGSCHGWVGTFGSPAVMAEWEPLVPQLSWLSWNLWFPSCHGWVGTFGSPAVMAEWEPSVPQLSWLSGNLWFPLSHDSCRQPETYKNQRLQLQFLRSWWWAVYRSKHVELLINIEIINSSKQLHLVGYFYTIYTTMHGTMNIKFTVSLWLTLSSWRQCGNKW